MGNINSVNGISEREAKIIAQNKLKESPGEIYQKVAFSSPSVDHINWNNPRNKAMKDNVVGYYERFQENWSVRFAPRMEMTSNAQVGCQVWVNKKSGDSQISCAPADL